MELQPEAGDGIVVVEVRESDAVMIEGLKLTTTGEEIRTVLEERIRVHERRAERWHYEAERPVESQTDECPILPEEMCENEAEEEEWRIEVLTFIREHIDPSEVYRLAQTDLEFGDLLPEKPGWMQQHESERENAVGFGLERMVRKVRGLGFTAAAFSDALEAARRTEQ